ncbi:MAG: hypothetical protein PHN54_01790 [Bacilli bacterium]|nr:hypothetical protein [Bacilli bacterium]
MKYKLTKKDIILSIILIITVCSIIYSIKWYKIYKEYNYSTSIISDYLSEVTFEEYKTYMQEVSNGFIYYCISDNIECRSFEKNFKKVVSKYGLNSQIIYLDIKDISIDNYYKKYTNLNEDINIPCIVYFENHLIIDYINSNMNEYEIIKFINKYE